MDFNAIIEAMSAEERLASYKALIQDLHQAKRDTKDLRRQIDVVAQTRSAIKKQLTALQQHQREVKLKRQQENGL